jgi:GNAT superfamily N-acetyltransferase
MTNLDIRFLPVDQVSPELDRAINTLDHLAFAGEQDDDPEFASIEWGSPDWMVLGLQDGELLSQLCLHKREIAVGVERVWVAGVGGVATHPDWQKRGFAGQVLRASETFMRETLQVPFGLLVCADETQPVYARCGWQTVARKLIFIQDEKPRRLETCVMILPLSNQVWPFGEINLLGLPW